MSGTGGALPRASISGTFMSAECLVWFIYAKDKGQELAEAKELHGQIWRRNVHKGDYIQASALLCLSASSIPC